MKTTITIIAVTAIIYTMYRLYKPIMKQLREEEQQILDELEVMARTMTDEQLNSFATHAPNRKARNICHIEQSRRELINQSKLYKS